MSHIRSRTSSRPQPSSTRVLAGGLIALAVNADRDGQTQTALRLVELAYGVLDREQGQPTAA